MSDFPRGWTLTAFGGNGAACVITAPAITGVVHVLDGFSAKSGGSAAQSPTITLSSSDGVFSSLILAVVDVLAGSFDTASESGLDLAAGPGAALTIEFSSNTAGDFEMLVAQGHDI